MTQDEKSILLKDLCARLPYGVRVNIKTKKSSYTATVCEITRNYICIEGGGDKYFSHGTYKPYLRPMSSMTEEEKKEYHKLCDNYYDIYFDSIGSIDWLNAHYFDYRGLIEKGLAIEAPEDMY